MADNSLVSDRVEYSSNFGVRVTMAPVHLYVRTCHLLESFIIVSSGETLSQISTLVNLLGGILPPGVGHGAVVSGLHMHHSGS